MNNEYLKHQENISFFAGILFAITKLREMFATNMKRIEIEKQLDKIETKINNSFNEWL